MVKLFCDQCGNQIETNRVSERLVLQHGKLKIEVYVAVNNVWNSGHACVTCVQRAVIEGEEVSR